MFHVLFGIGLDWGGTAMYHLLWLIIGTTGALPSKEIAFERLEGSC
jgi:hypothetical protein